MELRPYQQKASEVAVSYFLGQVEKPSIIVAPTAFGKSVLIADIAKKIDGKTIVLQPSKELLEQNYSKFMAMGGNAEIYSASAGRKEIGDVTYATIGSIKSIGGTFRQMGFKYVIVDECHLFPPNDSMFTRFIRDLGSNKVLGVTATPFRLQTGNDQSGFPFSKLVMLTSRSKNAGFFKEILHVHQIQEIITDGYWSPLVYQQFDFDNKILKYNGAGSDFTESSMAQAYENLDLEGSCKKFVQDSDRKSVLVFVPTVQQAMSLSSKLQDSVVVYGDMSKSEREEAVSGFKSGKYRVAVNVNVLSVGFDHPALDCVIFARPTASLAWFYQAAGRGTRLCPEKNDCLIVDFVGNLGRFGPLHKLTIERYKSSWQVFSGDFQLTSIDIRQIGSVRKEVVGAQAGADFLWPFGKHKGKKLKEVDSGYLRWVLENFEWKSSNSDLKLKIENEMKSRSLMATT